MIKLKKILSEGYAWERKPGGALPTLEDVKKIHEQDEQGKPSTEDTYKKIKDLSVTALKGYARRVGLPSDVIRDIKDTDSGIDEIMGDLYNDNWERDLMKQGAFESGNEESELRTARVDDIQRAIQLVEEAQSLVDNAISDTRLESNYEAYGKYGFSTLLGNGNPNDSSLFTLIDEMP